MKVYVSNRDFKVYFIVTYHARRFQVYTGLQTTEKFVGMVFPKSDKRGREKTARLAHLFSQMENYIYNNPNEQVKQMKEHLKEFVIGAKIADTTPFLDYMGKVGEAKRSINTRKAYKRVIASVSRYDDKCSFDTIDKEWITGFIEHEKQRGRCINGIMADVTLIKTVFTQANEEELTDKYPFHQLRKVKREQTKKRCLTLEQLRELRDIRLFRDKEVARDIFMLGFYLVGMNISDMIDLKKTDLKGGRITYKRNKTGRLYDIKVEPEAMRIIKKYSDGRKNRLLCFYESLGVEDGMIDYLTQKINRLLRRIGEEDRCGNFIMRCPIEEGISTYWNRHTWATLASEIDIPMEVIGRALGHSVWDKTITATYIKFDTKKIDDANRKVIDYLFADTKKEGS